jgi:hypothetical protein
LNTVNLAVRCCCPTVEIAPGRASEVKVLAYDLKRKRLVVPP